ncbi:hypothetical protein Scep_023481 [Stephania cephalantha]|uniref:Uncharacterized protein n=1 Tax=Stephania cephalantha TaxID=152367 RepID=A0AAP0HXB4_9MAGN
MERERREKEGDRREGCRLELRRGRPASTKVPGAATSSRGSDNAAVSVAGGEIGHAVHRRTSGAATPATTRSPRQELARCGDASAVVAATPPLDGVPAAARTGNDISRGMLAVARFGCEVRRCSGGEENKAPSSICAGEAASARSDGAATVDQQRRTSCSGEAAAAPTSDSVDATR